MLINCQDEFTTHFFKLTFGSFGNKVDSFGFSANALSSSIDPDVHALGLKIVILN